MTQSGENDEEAEQLNNTHYEHTISVSNSVFSKVEIFTLTVLTTFLCFLYWKNDIVIGDNLKLIAVILTLVIFIRILGKVFWGVKVESIFIVKALGLQTTTIYHSNFKSSKFIPWNSIKDVVINEAIVMQKVIFYLAVLIKSDKTEGVRESIIPIFVHSQPRLAELKKIYRNIQVILRH